MKKLLQLINGHGRSLIQTAGRRRFFFTQSEDYLRRNYANNVAEYNTVFGSVAAQRRHYLLRDAYDDMILDGVQPDRETFHHLIAGTMKGGRLQDAFFFRDEMKAMGLIPDDVKTMRIAALTCRVSRALNLRFSVLTQDAQLRNLHTFPPRSVISSGSGCSYSGLNGPKWLTASFRSAPVVADGDPVKEMHGKIIESIKVKRSAPPNAWLWLLMQKCKSRDDITLLFDSLEQLRLFRMSNLRIHQNFNFSLCQEVTKACVRAGALDFGKQTLWKHNIYGLTPTIGSANQLLSYAKEQKDVKLMVDIMRHLKKNGLPLQPATADIVFSICYDANNWGLISKYAQRFIQGGVKLRKTTFDIWLEFASKKGDLESLWKIENLRSEVYDRHTISSAVSCCKGLLLEGKHEDTATLIQDLIQNFPDSKLQDISTELQKLVSEWHLEVIKHKNQDDQKALIITLLKSGIPAMIKSFSSMGIDLRVNLDDLNIAEPVPC